jgi:hypothetical protein
MRITDSTNVTAAVGTDEAVDRRGFIPLTFRARTVLASIPGNERLSARLAAD